MYGVFFNYIKLVLVVDGTHLQEEFKGMIFGRSIIMYIKSQTITWGKLWTYMQERVAARSLIITRFLAPMWLLLHATGTSTYTPSIFKHITYKLFTGYAEPIFLLGPLSNRKRSDDFVDIEIFPPMRVPQVGWRQEIRIPSVGEVRQMHRSKRCGQGGHNQKTCRNR